PVHDALRLRLPTRRARVLIGIVLTCFGALSARAMYLQVWQNDFLQQEGASRFTRIIELPAHRGMITDRFGEPLAISTPVESVWVNPQDFDATPQLLSQFANLLQIPEAVVKKRIADADDREFMYLKRGLGPETAAQIKALDI